MTARAVDPKTLRRMLANPAWALPRFGQVHDQATATFVPYDPRKITANLQQAILSYFSDPPTDDEGRTRFMTLLSGRQMGKSLVAEFASYVKAAYTPGWDHVAIADTAERATYLHRRVHYLHERWPDALRAPTAPTVREARQLTFGISGGKMRILSAESRAVGIGQSPDSFHASECWAWADFEGSMTLILPSLVNRAHALVIFEATPWERGCAWHEHYLAAKRQEGRHFAVFFPFWDGLLNRRRWRSTWTLDVEEQRLLDKYGPQGLTLENLAFRREMLSTDAQLRRNPELFHVYYPFDDVSCWIASGRAAIPAHALERHLRAPLHPWSPPEARYEAPEADARYVIGVDPTGYAARDHAAVQVLKVWRGEWSQVAVFADHVDPPTLARKVMALGYEYNRALVVVESNGVGQALLALLQEADYPDVYCEKPLTPGIAITPKKLELYTSWLVDALLDDLVLRDEDTVGQLQTYKGDKIIEESPGAEIIRGAASPRRRARHHWDKVSALVMAVVGARWLPQRVPPREFKTTNIVPFRGEYPQDVLERYRAENQGPQSTRGRIPRPIIRKRPKIR